MNIYKKAAINIALLTIILSSGINSIDFSLLNDNLDSDINLPNQENTSYSSERRKKILDSFENGDYQSWQRIIGYNNKINRIIDEAYFQNFITARAAARRGEYDKALAITGALKKEIKEKLS